LPATTHESHPKKSTSADWQQRDLIWNCELPPMAKLVLFAFLECDRLGRGRELYPSVERIAWQTGLVYSSVHKVLKTLRQAGILENVGAVPSRLRGKVNRYRFHADRLPTRPEWHPPTADTLRNTESVNPDPLRNTASVDPRPTPYEHATDSVIGADRLRNSPRPTPYNGDERTYMNVRTERTERDRSTEVQAAARPVSSESESAHPEEVARVAYAHLTPAARAELENDARDRLKDMLAFVQPEKRAATIQRSVLHELEVPIVRARYGVDFSHDEVKRKQRETIQ
jgi:hypothetical protein